MEIDLSGNWRFQTGEELGREHPEYDDSRWGTMEVPAFWEDRGHQGYDGHAWYRTSVEIPVDWQDAPGVTFDVGKIADEDRVYFNGELIGTGRGWTRYRSYNVPLKIINFGDENIIAVWVNDLGGKGGIWEGPVRLRTGIRAYSRFNIEEY